MPCFGYNLSQLAKIFRNLPKQLVRFGLITDSWPQQQIDGCHSSATGWMPVTLLLQILTIKQGICCLSRTFCLVTLHWDVFCLVFPRHLSHTVVLTDFLHQNQNLHSIIIVLKSIFCWDPSTWSQVAANWGMPVILAYRTGWGGGAMAVLSDTTQG